LRWAPIPICGGEAVVVEVEEEWEEQEEEGG